MMPGTAPRYFLLEANSRRVWAQKSVKELLVVVKERPQFMWKSKYHMEIGGIDNLGPAFVHPDFF